MKSNLDVAERNSAGCPAYLHSAAGSSRIVMIIALLAFLALLVLLLVKISSDVSEEKPPQERPTIEIPSMGSG